MAQTKYTVVRSKQTNELAVRIHATNELVKQKENPVRIGENSVRLGIIYLWKFYTLSLSIL